MPEPTQINSSLLAGPISFLDSLSEKILNRFGHDMIDLTVVFPNSRAGFYLKKSFARLAAGQPLILPAMMSLDEWVGRQCKKAIINENEAIITLFECFKRVKNKDEILEDFFPLGQNIYADWEELIRNEVPVKAIFTSLQNWESTGLVFEDFLENDQIKLLQHFWENVEKDQKGISERMLALWKAMPAIFLDFQQTLAKKDSCTPAMAYADLASGISQRTLHDNGQFIFAGFGHLTKTEQRIIGHLCASGRGEIIWDFHPRYRQHARHEVNRLISRLEKNPVFRESIQKALEQPSEFSQPEIEIIGCQGFTGICQRIYQMVQKRESTEPIGLIALDSMLTPALIQFDTPPDFPFNFSMGYPLSFTPEAREILKKLEAWAAGHVGENIQTKPLFMHPEWDETALPEKEKSEPEWARTGEPTSGWNQLRNWVGLINQNLPESPYYQQVWTSLLECIAEFDHLASSIEPRHKTALMVFNLMQQIMTSKSIRIEGSAEVGMQVMGLYESRLLDFDHVVFASASDALLPGKGRQSLLPDNLRRAYGLLTRSQTLEDKLFQAWRLTHRARKITLLYDTFSDEKPSRLLFQLKFGGWFPVKELSQKFGASLPLPHLDDIAKNEFAMKQIFKFASKNGDPATTSLSPSSLHQLLQCSLRFYFSYVLGLKLPEDEVDFGMDVRDFGNWIHESIQQLLAGWQEQRTGNLEPDAAQMMARWHEMNGDVWTTMKGKMTNLMLDQFPVEMALGEKMVERFFHSLTNLPPMKWRANEVTLQPVLLRKSQGQDPGWSIKGRADIVMEWDNKTLLLDLKTGSFKTKKELGLRPDKLDNLKTKLLKNKDLFQMVMYKWMVWKNRMSGANDEFKPEVRTALFYMANPEPECLDPLENFNPEEENWLFEKLENMLLEALDELQNPAIAFARTEQIEHCAYCDFAGICQR